jgi:glycosyltransferase involved in cell wall biosynthesis
VSGEITNRYLIAIHIPLYRDADNRRYADELWFKDLQEHVAYMSHLVLACPLARGPAPEGWVPLDSDPRFSTVAFVDLPHARSLVQACVFLPITILRLWKAVSHAEVVQSGIAGWPIPMGWITAPIARLLRKPSVMIVESAPWRLQRGLPADIFSRINAAVFETLGRWCLRQTDLLIFSHENYRQDFLGPHSSRGHVNPATWIDAEWILSDEQAAASWAAKSSELRVLFAGQLKAAKGVLVLLDAVNLLAAKSVKLKLDILGAGELESYCGSAAASLKGPTEVHMLGTVPYGAQFFELLRGYHAVVVPSISDEQPRIVYDAYSQALPVLGSSTPGILECVHNQKTGWLVQPCDALALSNLLQKAAEYPQQLQRMGLEGLQLARAMTHQAMHEQRKPLLRDLLAHKSVARQRDTSSSGTRR